MRFLREGSVPLEVIEPRYNSFQVETIIIIIIIIIIKIIIYSDNSGHYPSFFLLFKTQLHRLVRTSQETHYVSATSPTG
jgi:hypothetical protein